MIAFFSIYVVSIIPGMIVFSMEKKTLGIVFMLILQAVILSSYTILPNELGYLMFNGAIIIWILEMTYALFLVKKRATHPILRPLFIITFPVVYFFLSIFVILSTANICSVDVNGEQVLVNPSIISYVGFIMVGLLFIYVGWHPRKEDRSLFGYVSIIIGLYIASFPLQVSNNQIVVDPNYVSIEMGCFYSPKKYKIEFSEIESFTIVSKSERKGKSTSHLTWRHKNGTIGDGIPMGGGLMTTAMPSIYQRIKLHKIPISY